MVSREELQGDVSSQLSHLEIERKFLVPNQPDLSGAKSNQIIQGYLAISEDGTEVRIRQKGDRYFETVKTTGTLSRGEFEIEISREQYASLWPATTGKRLEKRRYEIPYQGYTIELDVYEGTLAGLIVAEIEFPSEADSERFTPLPWFGREVTSDPAYKNQSLVRYGRPSDDAAPHKQS